jgi:FkbM family methyltransferase
METQSIPQLAAEFASGRLGRKEYWLAMQLHHRRLRGYTQLVSRAKLAGIEIGSEELRIVLPNGLRFRWDPEDIRTAPNILINHGEYEANELIVIQQVTRNAQVAFDIGSNVGWYTLHLALWLGARGGKVFAFEPLPPTFSALSRNLALNDCAKRVEASRISLADQAGTATFYVPAFTGSVAASRRPLFPQERNTTFECRVTTLDQFAEQHKVERIDFLKCDVEGSELAVLRGGLKTLSACRPVILLEMLRKWAATFEYHPNAIIELLAGLGYDCGCYDGNRFRAVATVAENSVQTNFFFLHEETHAHLRTLEPVSA